MYIEALASCLQENNTQHIDFISRLFFKGGVIQLKSTDVEFISYDFLLTLKNHELKYKIIYKVIDNIDLMNKVIEETIVIKDEKLFKN
jgi:hypothetical protein